MRSRSLRSSSMLMGFISLEEVHRSPPSSTSSSSTSSSATLSSSPPTSDAWKRRRSIVDALTRQKWVYAVLHHGRLRCYRRRADIKLNREPFRVVLLDLEATLVGERQSLIVQSRATGKTLRIRVHARSTTTYLQWVTALYLARLDHGHDTLRHSETEKKPQRATSRGSPRAKRVTFNEETSECIFFSEPEYTDSDDGSPTATVARRDSVDLGELFYSRADLAEFREAHWKTQQAEKTPLHVGRKIVRSLVAKLRRRPSLEEDHVE